MDDKRKPLVIGVFGVSGIDFSNIEKLLLNKMPESLPISVISINEGFVEPIEPLNTFKELYGLIPEIEEAPQNSGKSYNQFLPKPIGKQRRIK